MLIAVGRHAEALPILASLAAAEPGSADVRCLMAHAFLGLGRARDALEQAEAAVAAEPGQEWGHRLRAFALLELGRRKPALAAAREAVRLAPVGVEGLVVLGDAQLACRDRTGATATARRIVELQPNDIGGYDLLGRVALTRARYREAEEHFREALRVHPGDPGALNNLGVALQGQGRRREAVHLFGQASAANPHDNTARHNAMRAARISVSVFVVFQLVQVALHGKDARGQQLAVVLGAVVVMGALAFVLFRLARGRRHHHEYPVAPPELLRSLRRQSSWRDWLPRRRGGDPSSECLPLGMLVLGTIVGFGLTLVSLYTVTLPQAVGATPIYQMYLFAAGGFAFGSGFLVAVLRRRRL